jgi:hypothetical protein
MADGLNFALAILTARPERRIKALEGDVKALPERETVPLILDWR